MADAALALALVFGVGAAHPLHGRAGATARYPQPACAVGDGGLRGIAGGVIGLVLNRPDYRTAPFFAVSVMVGTYHIFSEWLSLIIKTRSSQAVKRLLDLQPATARVVRGGGEARTANRGGRSRRSRADSPRRTHPGGWHRRQRSFGRRSVTRNRRVGARRKVRGRCRDRRLDQRHRHASGQDHGDR